MGKIRFQCECFIVWLLTLCLSVVNILSVLVLVPGKLIVTQTLHLCITKLIIKSLNPNCTQTLEFLKMNSKTVLVCVFVECRPDASLCPHS